MHPKNAMETIEVGHTPEIDQGNGNLLVDIGSKQLDEGTRLQLKMADDGRTILIPQPSDDEKDTLNWSPWKKMTVFITIALGAFMTDFQASAGAPLLVPQALEWETSPTHVNYAGNLNLLLLGIGGLFWLPVMSSWGRAPTLFWINFIGTGLTLGCALVENFDGYYAIRGLMGFFFSGGLTVGLACVQDSFFFHEQARKIGLWTAVLLIAPYCAPMFGYFILARTRYWRGTWWMIFGLGCVNLALCVAFLDETWYRRDIALSDQPARGSRLKRVLGIWQARLGRTYFLTPLNATKRLLAVLIHPVAFPVFLYYAMNLMWVVGVNQTTAILFETPVEKGGYGLDTLTTGYLALTPVIAVALGEVIGYWTHDWVARRYIAKHQGIFKPEARLTPIYACQIMMVVGLVLIGQALGHHLSLAVVIIGWGLFVTGQMIMTGALTAYILDVLPKAPGEIAALLNASRMFTGFSVGYFQLSWGQKVGFAASFGTEAGISAASIVVIIVLHVWGEKLRSKGGVLRI